MVDPQELANRIGAAQRATEDALSAGNIKLASQHAAEQHQNLTEAFAFARDVAGIPLDWNAVAGIAGGDNFGGGAKDAPPQVEG